MRLQAAARAAVTYVAAIVVVGLAFGLQFGWQAAAAMMATMAVGAIGIGIWLAMSKAWHRRSQPHL